MNAKNNLLKRSLVLVGLLSTMIGFGQLNTGTLEGDVFASSKSDLLANVKIKVSSMKTKVSKTTITDSLGHYKIEGLPAGMYYFTASSSFIEKFRRSNVEIKGGETTVRDANVKYQIAELIEAVDNIEIEAHTQDDAVKSYSYDKKESRKLMNYSASPTVHNSSVGNNEGYYRDQQQHNTESYNTIDENVFMIAQTSPLSTFSVDVDAASYSNVRRFILSGNKPDKGAVRVEEMINYFNYDYDDPKNNDPFSITTEVGECPWSENKLVHIGLQGKRIDKSDLPPSNLVFLLDVSGSMNSANKLPLLKKSFSLLVNELTDQDKVSIVVYAGAAGMVLEPTKGSDGTKILESMEKLRAGGSTAGGAGIELAYKTAQANFIKGGNNRVILATDGDFNIGMSSDASMESLIVKKRETGIFLTCLGFGTGNFKDSKMETLADKGNGNYAYIDNLLEAKKVLVAEMGATLLTIAKDVKIQVEFNPSVIESYRLVGYENRLLNNEDFNDDTKDAGEIGAGHSVTALYEVVLKGEGTAGTKPDVDPLKYQSADNKTEFGDEMLTVKFRYKAPDGDKSKLIERTLVNKIEKESSLSNNFNFAAAVAQYGMLLRDSEHKGTSTFDNVLKLAAKSKGKDKNGYRAEFLRIVDATKVVYGG
jgi:Ca-activated chloride channel family protein